MAIHIKDNAQTKQIENVLSSIFASKTAGAETVLESFNYLRLNTLEEIKGIFTREELMSLVEMHNGIIFDARTSSNKGMLVLEIEDKEKFDKQSEQFNYDHKKLIAKIEKLTSAQVYFLILEISKMWEKGSANGDALENFLSGFAITN
jgi:hypothetical protein